MSEFKSEGDTVTLALMGLIGLVAVLATVGTIMTHEPTKVVEAPMPTRELKGDLCQSEAREFDRVTQLLKCPEPVKVH